METYNWSNKLFLIVEDDALNAKLLIKYLKLNKADYILAINGEIGIEEYRNNPKIDIVLMDIQLPDISGYDAMKEILKINPEAKIIAQTAHAFIKDKELSLKSGCCDYLAKPIDIDDFSRTINKYL